MYKVIVHKLNRKIKRVHLHSIGVTSMAKVARRLEILDKVLTLFGMRLGATQNSELDVQGGRIMGVRLTVYFMEVTRTQGGKNE